MPRRRHGHAVPVSDVPAEEQGPRAPALRKPPGVSFETWVERQVREAQERGAFDGLPGAGKPLPREAGDELAWVRQKALREGLPVSALLPPALALAKEVEDLPGRLAGLRSEERVREVVEDLDARIRRARLGPQEGPPVRVRQLDVEALVSAWRDAQPPPAREPQPRRSRWRRR